MLSPAAIQDILRDIQYLGWVFLLSDDNTIQVQFQSCGQPHRGRKWRLSPWMTKSEIVQTALMAVLAAEEHEVREHFQYKGEAIYGPHYNVDDLVALKRTSVPDVRVTTTALPRILLTEPLLSEPRTPSEPRTSESGCSAAGAPR